MHGVDITARYHLGGAVSLLAVRAGGHLFDTVAEGHRVRDIYEH